MSAPSCEGDELEANLSGSYWIEANQHDLTVLAARVLYEAGRLDGDEFLAALAALSCVCRSRSGRSGGPAMNAIDPSMGRSACARCCLSAATP